MNQADSVSLKLVFLLPVYNDWDSARLLIRNIDEVLISIDQEASILIVDDHSSTSPQKNFIDYDLSHIANIRILSLRRNLGHQRAIAIGLTQLYDERSWDAVVIMDADGEDRPEDIPALLEKFKDEGNSKIIFAERLKRSENMIFKILYKLYRLVHKILTGIPVKVGNFSIIPAVHLPTLTVTSEMWNHYTASVYQTRIPRSTVPTIRGKRLAGKPKMNFVNLVMHGLSAISVFSDVVGVRLFIASFLLIMALLFLLVIVICIRFFTNLAIPGWATFVSGLILVGIFQVFTFICIFILFTLRSRNNLDFIPIRDYKYFINGLTEVYPGNG
jgi:glycosyltransferase involved in cell wall biosynthesis